MNLDCPEILFLFFFFFCFVLSAFRIKRVNSGAGYFFKGLIAQKHTNMDENVLK